MTHFIIPEDKDENWKNSEVMRNFVELLQSEASADMPKSGADFEQLETLWETVASEPKVAQASANDYQLEKQATYNELVDVLGMLNKIASDSVKYGNEKATYQIELAASKVRDLLKDLEEGE